MKTPTEIKAERTERVEQAKERLDSLLKAKPGSLMYPNQASLDRAIEVAKRTLQGEIDYLNSAEDDASWSGMDTGN